MGAGTGSGSGSSGSGGTTTPPIYAGGTTRCSAEFYGAKTVSAVDASADTLTIVAHGFTNGQELSVRVRGGVLPTPLLSDTFYFVVGATTDTLQLAYTPGGTPINLSDTGSGFIEAMCLSDPATVSLTVEAPDNTESTYTYAGAQITKAMVGIYYRDIIATLQGTYNVRWVSTGNPADVLQYSFTVLPSNT